jgi:NADPH-dependent 2,4-dienoyl-CoA reductase/sulfur reductase-like enzyme
MVSGADLTYDYLVIATGLDLAFDEIPGFGPHGNTQSVCHVDHALMTKDVFDALVANPRPVVIGAVQGESCFGPAFEFLFILETALRRAKVRDRVPMTFVTSEPYIGHLGLDGVGAQYRPAFTRSGTQRSRNVERRLPRRLRRRGRRVRGAAANSAAQCQLVSPRQMGACG